MIIKYIKGISTAIAVRKDGNWEIVLR